MTDEELMAEGYRESAELDLEFARWAWIAKASSPGLDRAALIEDLIAWSTDPNGMDREAMEHVDRDGWGIGR